MKILLAICAYCGLLALGVLIGKWLGRMSIRREIRKRMDDLGLGEPYQWAERRASPADLIHEDYDEDVA